MTSTVFARPVTNLFWVPIIPQWGNCNAPLGAALRTSFRTLLLSAFLNALLRVSASGIFDPLGNKGNWENGFSGTSAIAASGVDPEPAFCQPERSEVHR
jgi:hypothetical protein